MKRYTESVILDQNPGRTFHSFFRGRTIAAFDIETSGLSPQKDYIMLTGIMLMQDNYGQLVQYFAESPEEEPLVIAETLRTLTDADMLLTYNGRRFDIPFLNTRRKKFARSHTGLFPKLPLSMLYNLDLYPLVRYYSGLNAILPSFTQKSLEVYMGLSDSRTDRIDGGISIDLYQQYLMSQDPQLERQIILHNHDDVILLGKLLPILRQVDLDKGLFNLGMPVGKSIIAKSQCKGKDLLVTLKLPVRMQSYLKFPTAEEPYSIEITEGTNLAEIRIPLEEPARNLLILDAQKLLNCSSNKELEQRLNSGQIPKLSSGYLILKDSDGINYTGCNQFLKQFIPLVEQVLKI